MAAMWNIHVCATSRLKQPLIRASPIACRVRGPARCALQSCQHNSAVQADDVARGKGAVHDATAMQERKRTCNLNQVSR
jgi:hypothetical protein